MVARQHISGKLYRKIIAEGKSKLFFRSIIVKNPEFFAGAGVGAEAENSMIFRLRLQLRNTGNQRKVDKWIVSFICKGC